MIQIFVLMFIINIFNSLLPPYIAEATFRTVNPDSKILIINAFDAMALKVRNNKKELFKELGENVIFTLHKNLQLSNREVIVMPEVIKSDSLLDSIVNDYIKEQNINKVIVLSSLDTYFDQTEVVVEKNDDKSKTRTAFFDLCSIIHLKIYGSMNNINEREFKTCENFTSRKVVSGVLAAGPDIVAKRKHALRITVLNAEKIKTFLE